MRSRRGVLKHLLCIGLAIVLLARFERQRFGELDGDSAQKAIDVIDPANTTRTGEVCHIEGIIGAVTGDTEAGGYVLAGVGTILVGIACKCGGMAGNINHLPL